MFGLLHFKKRISVGLMTLLMAGSVAGCGASSAEQTGTADNTPKDSNSQTVSNYEVKEQLPNILVDQVGYNTESEKIAIFRGENLPEEFQVKDLETGEVVYTGQIDRSSLNEEVGEYNAVGRFNDFKEPGQYYIYADIVGESYSFSIAEDVYQDVFNEACKEFYINRCGMSLSEGYAGENAHTACHTQMAILQDDPSVQIEVNGGWHMDEQADRDTYIGSRIAENLLTAYEMNPSSFTDETGIPESGNGIPDILDEVRYEVEWLLKMQDSRTGGIYGAAMTDTSKSGDVFTAPVYVTGVSTESTISFSAMAARFSFFYQKYDPDFATTCLKAADRAYSCFLNNQKPEDNTGAFNASAQLYRATGNQNYLNVLNMYFAKSDFAALFEEDNNVFSGAITYLSTNQPVDMDQCGVIMKLLMKRSESISAKASNNGYKVTDSGSTADFSALLADMKCLTITDHIIYNHEYTTIIENHAHFLMGMNSNAINYVTEETENSYASKNGAAGIMNDPQNDALFIFMLSVLQQQKS
ncbi:glycoside hydrolase family 9 protein [Butyrivibrio proteoclasticus]|uniref:glycoside hydrolase family 9 protein n=1 Tax=Butyrivibrio proteoclasticus TaxID=43305 RepID=UPI000478B514|nr:glycoside hydrolase family 9 protein [Butyrivibrio proteoclasticus]